MTAVWGGDRRGRVSRKKKEFHFGGFPAGECRDQLYGNLSLRSLRESLNRKGKGFKLEGLRGEGIGAAVEG